MIKVWLKRGMFSSGKRRLIEVWYRDMIRFLSWISDCNSIQHGEALDWQTAITSVRSYQSISASIFEFHAHSFAQLGVGTKSSLFLSMISQSQLGAFCIFYAYRRPNSLSSLLVLLSISSMSCYSTISLKKKRKRKRKVYAAVFRG